MNRPPRLLALLVLLAALLPVPALAQLDSTVRQTTMRAGPDDVFPPVSRLRNATNLHVVGCVPDRAWCDVQYGRLRGFVRAADIATSPRLREAPTVAFSVAEYWDAHYRRRPWYASRDRWVGWGTPGFVPPSR